MPLIQPCTAVHLQCLILATTLGMATTSHAQVTPTASPPSTETAVAPVPSPGVSQAAPPSSAPASPVGGNVVSQVVVTASRLNLVGSA